MGKFKSHAWPAPSKGVIYTDKPMVQPNQSMSLQEILERFTRNEALPIGREVNYHESEDDLEKVQHMDLVDREEFVNGLKETRKRFDSQEAKKKADQEAAIKAELEKKIRTELEEKQAAPADKAK